MTDLEDLAEIAEASAFGFHGLTDHGALRQGRKPFSEACGAGHPWTVTNTRWHKDKRGRNRRVCRACDKIRNACRGNAKRMPAASEGK